MVELYRMPPDVLHGRSGLVDSSSRNNNKKKEVEIGSQRELKGRCNIQKREKGGEVGGTAVWLAFPADQSVNRN